MRFTIVSLAIALTAVSSAQAGPLLYGVCQSGCNAVTQACYTGAGYTFGTISALAAPPAILACNTAQGLCVAACAAVTLAVPTP